MSNQMKILDQWSLEQSYQIAQVEKYPDDLYLSLFKEHMAPGHAILPWESSLEAAGKEKLKQLRSLLKDRYQIRLALLHQDKLIGWSYGWQDSVHSADFYMAGSLILPEYRKKQFYTRLVQKILDLTADDGFTAVRSRHVCTNNAVLIAKLKMGFMINGFEQDDTMGTLVRTIYHHNELRRRAAYFRAGKIDEHLVLNSLVRGEDF